ncbi:MAG: hypothetical protein QGG40_11465 [Myxococcota bacterium]|nr:hypothetical protein [Myxococcota bacterium]
MLRFPNILLLFLGIATSAMGAPVVSPMDQAQAQRIAFMSGSDPVSRFNQLLVARDLSEGALFALASTHPGLVEQVLSPRFELVLEYLDTIPAPVLRRLRQGDTVIRSDRALVGDEREVALELCESFALKCKKLEAVRLGPYESRVFRIEVTAKGRTGTIGLAWPSTPERDQESRSWLTKHFGARPSPAAYGAGARLPLEDGSFEEDGTLGAAWKIEDVRVLGTRSPVAEILVDRDSSIDGSSSLRFYASHETRLFKAAVQRVSVAPGTRLRVRVQHQTDRIRPEFQQHPGEIYLALEFEDIAGRKLEYSQRTAGRMDTHTWEEISVDAVAPPGSAYVRVVLTSALSGTAWFDGVVLEIAP